MIGKFNQGQIVDTGSVQIILENIKKLWPLMRVLLKAGPLPMAQGILHGPQPGGPAAHGPWPKAHFTAPQPGGPAAHGPWPKAHFTAHGPVARLTVHIPQFRIFSAVFYSACSDLCSKMEVGEFWFLCNFNHFNPLQSLYLFVAFFSRHKC